MLTKILYIIHILGVFDKIKGKNDEIKKTIHNLDELKDNALDKIE